MDQSSQVNPDSNFNPTAQPASSAPVNPTVPPATPDVPVPVAPPQSPAQPLTPQPTNSLPPKRPLPWKQIILVLLGVGLLVALLWAVKILFFQYKARVTLPFEIRSTAATPQEKFEEVISGNLGFSQLRKTTQPDVPVTENDEQIVGTLVDTKSELSGSETVEGTEAIKRRETITIQGKTLPYLGDLSLDFDIKMAKLSVTTDDPYKFATDVIVNAKLGEADLSDVNMDSLHISLTQTDQLNSYLKIGMSDYLLVFLDNIMNVQEAMGEDSNVIEVDTDTIWPYLGKYLHVPRSVEEARFGADLDQDAQEFLNSVREREADLYDTTIGSVLSYINVEGEQQETLNDQPVTKYLASLNSEKLVDVVGQYLAGMEELYTESVAEYEDFCQESGQNEAQINDCLAGMADNLTQTNKETNQLALAMARAAQAAEIVVYVNNNDLTVAKMTATVFFQNNQLPDGNWLMPLPIETLSISLDSEELSRDENIIISAPTESVELLSQYQDDDKDSYYDLTYSEESFQGELYRENRDNFLTTAYGGGREICSGMLGNNYCLTVPALWDDYESDSDYDLSLYLERRNADPNDYETASMSIRQNKDEDSAFSCYADDNATIKDITTQDGYTLKLVEDVGSDLFGDDLIYHHICTDQNGKLMDTSAYGEISINPGRLSFEEISSEVVPMLSSLKLAGAPLDIKVDGPPAFTPIILSGEASPVIKSTEDGTKYVELYGLTLANSDSQRDCNIGDDYIRETFDLGPDGFAVVPNGKGVCFADDLCGVCYGDSMDGSTNGNVECAGQVCAP